MAVEFEGSSEEYNSILAQANTVFTCIFIGEASLKIIAFNFKIYIKNPWNKFDFIVVLSSILDLFMDAIGSSLSFLRVGP